MNESQRDGDFEQHLRADLADYFGSPPLPQAIWEQVAQRIDTVPITMNGAVPPMETSPEPTMSFNDSGVTHGMPQRKRGNRVVAWLAAILIVMLLGGFFTWAVAMKHPHVAVSGIQATATPAPAPLPTCVSTPPPTLATQASLHGYTFTFDSVVATPTNLSVKFHSNFLNQYDLDNLHVVDACNFAYHPFETSGAISPTADSTWVSGFPPLATNSAQRLTLVIPDLRDRRAPNSPAIAGPWQISFLVTPQLTGSQALTTSGSTHDGLTITPTHITWFNNSNGIDQTNGGVRLRIHLSGLPPVTQGHIDEGVTFEQGYTFVDGSGQAPISNPGDGHVGLAVPPTTTPQSISQYYPVDLDDGGADAGNPHNIVSRNGEADIDLIFFGVHLPTHGVLTLSIDQIPITYTTFQTQGKPSYQQYDYAGPWQIQIPIG